jgi:hypothetical protein
MEFVIISTDILWREYDVNKLTDIIQFFRKRNFTNQHNFIGHVASSSVQMFYKIKF